MRELRREAAALQRWLFEQALPLWWEVGADRVSGGYHEAIDLDGTPLSKPRRARSIARMAFSFCEAGRIGWIGPWREAAEHALVCLGKHFVSKDDTVVSVVDVDGRVSDPGFDLYNQAFALLAFAEGQRVFTETACWRRQAATLRTTLQGSFAHPLGGFRESRDGRLPQRANPHMHLLEAALAWCALEDHLAWRAMADDIAMLCLDRLIDPESGAVREFFDGEWSPAAKIAGRIAEPGHCYEWAFLLDRWARLTGRKRPAAIARLIEFADARGLNRDRGVAINAVLIDGGVHDPVARLWAQAERVRAYVCDRRPEADIAAALRGLRRFLATPRPGLWFDQLSADNRFVHEPARSTQLYHIIGAVAELAQLAD
jgi:mannose-6-phosphate isomerase